VVARLKLHRFTLDDVVVYIGSHGGQINQYPFIQTGIWSFFIPDENLESQRMLTEVYSVSFHFKAIPTMNPIQGFLL
jgi:hypothetical protein